MRELKRVVFLVLLVGLGCSKQARHCPDGTSLDSKKSVAGKTIWCRSQDGKTARWIELHPGGTDRRQSCGYREGKPVGSFTAWHPGGRVWIAGEYADGKKIGKWVQWDKNGMKVAEGDYSNGQFVAGAPVGIAAGCEKNLP
jgi:hypothetical protein